MNNILITGGAGFIGSNLALQLEKLGYGITIIDNLSSGNKKNLSKFRGKLIIADVSKNLEIKQKFTTIFHLAAITDTTYGDNREMLRANVEGFENILKVALSGKSQLIYASSAAIYGNGQVPMQENQIPRPLNAYAESKLKMDKIAQKYFNKIHIVGLRYFNVFGPGEAFKGRSSSMINQLAVKMLQGLPPKLFKSGEQERDHIYIKDVVDATILAMRAKKSGIYNVGTGVSTSFNQILKILNRSLKTNFKPEYIENINPRSYQNLTRADSTLAKKYLGFESQHQLAQAIEQYCEFIQNES